LQLQLQGAMEGWILMVMLNARLKARQLFAIALNAVVIWFTFWLFVISKV
jgi:hypothetical protein